jgi:Fe-S-cluster-containing dehydrogenase component/CRP-like cAMP-binding protein
MNQVTRNISKPKRWDEPFDPQMEEGTVDHLLSLEPFRSMRLDAFSPLVPLRGILKNDCRLNHYENGDIVIRQGEYGSSAFLVLDGEVIVSLRPLPEEILGRQPVQKKSWWQAVAQLWSPAQHPEMRNTVGPAQTQATNTRQEQQQTRVFLQDFASVLDLNQISTLRAGEIFGELSAITRTPRTATVIAKRPTQLLEIRWQGLRDLMQRDATLKRHIDKLYRETSLQTFLAESPCLQGLPATAIAEVAAATEFESFGSQQWTAAYRSMSQADIAERIKAEPVIAQAGDYVNGLLMIRNGFVRVSRVHGAGEQTIEYLGKGQSFGLREIAHNFRTREQRPWQLNLRAVGYVDILRISTDVVEKLILPQLPEAKWPAPLPPATTTTPSTGTQRRLTQRSAGLSPEFLEQLVENRLINGTQAMVIDLHRCTRCDDCVRACADAHGHNPRFIREGTLIDQFQFTQACMHCLDPVCMIGCPTGAIGRHQQTGTVTINDRTCIGCGTCAASCPYQNIQMVPIRDPQGLPIVDQQSGDPVRKATKCDLCVEQLGGPACQRACPHDALIRIDLTQSSNLVQWIGGG